jgi:diguanylate cyclase (GGDEF)-like protein/PAS domain S-box-containing protein
MTHSDHDPSQQVEELLQFVYLMPVAIIKLGSSGDVQLLNPIAVQLLETLSLNSGLLTGPERMDALSPGLSGIWIAARGRVGLICEPMHHSFRLAGARWLHLVLRVIRPDEACTMISIEDVTTTVEQERELHRNRQQLGFVLERIEGYCVAMLDTAGMIAEWNPSIDRMFGSSATHLVGASVGELLRSPHKVNTSPLFPQMVEVIREQGLFRRETPLKHESGRVIWGELIVTPTVDGAGATSGYVVVIRDVSEHHDARQQLLNEAMTDPLTGLLNRRGLATGLEGLARVPPSSHTIASWIMLDIDHFKRVNDTHGHEVGDMVLKQIAALLTTCSRAGDLVVRLGGEEFVVVLPGVPLTAALATAERYRNRVQISELSVGSQSLRVTASFGVCAQPRDLPWSDALRAADEALYQAKSSGRNRVVAASTPVAQTIAR